VRPVEVSVPVVDVGLYDSPAGLALVLANYTYEPVSDLNVRVKSAKGVNSVFSVEQNKEIPFKLDKEGDLEFSLPLKLNDLILLRRAGKTKN